MIRSKHLAAALGAVLVATLAQPPAQADSIAEVEGARAKDRQGAYLTRQEREKLRRYGRNDDYGYRGGYGYRYYDRPSIGIYVGPRPYYDDPYGY